MPKTHLTSKSFTSSAWIRDPLWIECQRHAAKAYDYTERGEWLGAYYNTLLAAVACKHCVEHHRIPFIESETHTLTDAHQFQANSLVVQDNPRATLIALYAAIPYFQKKVVQFQRAFACPNVQESNSSASTNNHEMTSEDCESIQAIDLTQVATVSFDDLVGNDLCKTTILDTLVYPIQMPHMYPRLARALLFYGPPGTGKTLLAKATAHELNRNPSTLRVLFFAPTGDAFKGKFVGETEANIVKLFRCASQKAAALEAKLKQPRVLSVIFIDEIDSIARNRETAGSSAATVANATNTLLQMMDGMQSFDNIVVMGATNFPWNLDGAILRRFGQKVYVPLPDEEGVRNLIEYEIVTRLKESLCSKSKPSYVQAQRSVHECFEQWAPIHGLDNEALSVLASEMLTTNKKAGYAPRDIKRLCDIAMTREAQKVSRDSFFRVQRTSKQAHKTDESSDTHSSTVDSGKQLQLSLSEELLAVLDGCHVSRETFARLQTIAGQSLDTEVTPEYIGRPPFPSVLHRRRQRVNKDESHTFNHIPLHPSKHAHVYQNVMEPKEYGLFRTIVARVRHSTHVIPVYAWCTLGKAIKTIPTIEMLLANATCIWFVLDDTLYSTHFAKGNTIVSDIWTTAHPEPWLTDEPDTSWIQSLIASYKTPDQKLSLQSPPVRVGRLFLTDDHEWMECQNECSVTTEQHTNTSNVRPMQCVHLTYSAQTFVNALREVRPSSKLENLRELDKYQKGDA